MNAADDFFLPADLAALVEAELAKGERLTWVGRPIAWRLARSSLVLLVFGIPFTAFAVFWIAMTSGIASHFGSGPVMFFPLFGVPFVLVGLGLVTSPLWAYRRALGTIYAITDRRAFIVERGLWGKLNVRSLEPEGLAILSRTQYADGSGNLVFQRDYRQRPGHANRPGYYVDIGFLAVPDVKEVEEHIRALAQPAGDRGDR